MALNRSWMRRSRTPMRQMSAKRLAEALASGAHPSSTFLTRSPRTPRTSPGTSGLGGSVGGAGAVGVPRPRTALPKVSAKKLALTEGRLPALLSHPRATGPDWNTVEAVLERDSWSCVVCGGGIFGERGFDWSIGHRRPRRNGGDPRPETNLPGNLFTLHGSGTTGCHGVVESMREQAIDLGWILHADDVPADKPIQHALHGYVLLTNLGGFHDFATAGA